MHGLALMKGLCNVRLTNIHLSYLKRLGSSLRISLVALPTTVCMANLFIPLFVAAMRFQSEVLGERVVELFHGYHAVVV